MLKQLLAKANPIDRHRVWWDGFGGLLTLPQSLVLSKIIEIIPVAIEETLEFNKHYNRRKKLNDISKFIPFNLRD